MKSFAVKRDENDPRWEKFIEWYQNGLTEQGFDIPKADWEYLGVDEDGDFNFSDSHRDFDRILTLDEWEREFINPQPQLASREYDEGLLSEFKQYYGNTPCTGRQAYQEFDGVFINFLNQRYAKTDRISEIKAEIERLKKELKEIEG